jgi:non-heme chloroperoxidase
MKTIDANGASFNYIQDGERGTPAIFVHESLNDYRTWRIQVPDFSTHNFRAIAYSRRNHPPNQWADYPSDYSIKTEADDLRAFIEGLNFKEPVHLIGASYGAFACIWLAIEHPELVASLVIAEPPILSLITEKYATYFDRKIFEARMESSVIPLLDSGNIKEGVRGFVDMINGEGSFERLGSESKERMLENGKTLKYELTDSRRDSFTPEDARKIRAPTLLLRAESSPVMFQLITQELYKTIAGAKIASIPNSSHLMHLHNPRAYDEAVIKFLENPTGSSRESSGQISTRAERH